MDALASFLILHALGPDFVEGSAFCKPFVLISWKVPDFANPLVFMDALASFLIAQALGPDFVQVFDFASPWNF